MCIPGLGTRCLAWGVGCKGAGNGVVIAAMVVGPTVTHRKWSPTQFKASCSFTGTPNKGQVLRASPLCVLVYDMRLRACLLAHA